MTRIVRHAIAPLATALAVVFALTLATASTAQASYLPTGGKRHRLVIGTTTQIHSLSLFTSRWAGACYTMNYDTNPKFVAQNQWWLNTGVNVDNKSTIAYYAFTSGNCAGTPYMSGAETVPSVTPYGPYYLLRLVAGPCYGVLRWGNGGCMPFQP